MQVTVRLAIDIADPLVRTRTVLLVSADRDWRAVVRRVLEQHGYRVLAARHTGHALVECMRHDGRIDLLLTDCGLGRRRSDFPARIFKDHPRARLLHLESRPRTRDELLATVAAVLH